MSSLETSVSSRPVTLWRKTCIAAARLGGEVLKRYRGKVTAREKQPKDLVTEADLESQRVIEEFLRQRFPTHRILGEESIGVAEVAETNGDQVRWIIDPLDGTTNFIHGFPQYAISIALAYR
ncbi:MAG TPA: inositol monophosphatase, partial [Planctomycetaceae bacterium]|nr:inositol monophosphatase [Planctomycetaceae bacterium]